MRERLQRWVASSTSHRRGHATRERAARADHLVVATANIQYREREEHLVELVRRLQQKKATAPAVLALQEVQGDDGDGEEATHTVYQIADLFRMSMRFQGARRHPLLGSLRGSFGNAVLSRAGFVDEVGGGRIDLPGGWEPRVAVDVAVPLDDGSALRVLGTHLDHGGLRGFVADDNAPGADQLERLIDAAERDLRPTVILGDFNLTPRHVHKILRGSRFADAIHKKTTAGGRRIDYVLVDACFSVVAVDVCDLTGVSDHHAVVAVLQKKKHP